MPQVWIKFVLRHAVVLAIGGAIGFLYDQMMIGVLVALCGLLGLHILQLFRLERWLRTGKPGELPDGDGVWPRIFARIQFTNERARQNRKNWRRLVKELRASARAFPDGGIILNPHHEIINYNKAARRLLGLKKRRDKGQRIDNLIRHPAFVAYLESHEDSDSVAIPGLIGADVWLSCRIIPYGPDQRLLLIRDITQSVILERTRSDFVANASHELRTPLTAVLAHLDIAQNRELDEATRQSSLVIIQQWLRRLARLVQDMVQLGRLEMSETVEKRPLDLFLAAESAVAELILIAEAKNITVSLEAAGRLSPILGNADKLKQVFLNVLDNSVKYGRAGDQIKICLTPKEEGVRVTIQDTGPGIAPEHLPRVTERLYRARKEIEGSGLGLAIAAEILRLHNAHLEIQSPGRDGGTGVSVSFLLRNF